MKIKRYKKAERYMTLYKNNFGFREPFQVLLDGTFCQVALDHKVNIQEQLPRYLKGECKLLTTACVIDETKRLGKPVHGAYLIVSQFPVHNCGHESPVSASKCLSSFIVENKNRDHYLVATQDHKLRQKIAKEVVCPLIKLANNALVMEKPADRVVSKVNRTHHYLANRLKDDELESLVKLKQEEKLELDAKPEQARKKKKRFNGPNPLSCKKKQKSNKTPDKKVANPESNEVNFKVRRRKKPKIARHVQDYLKKVTNSSVDE